MPLLWLRAGGGRAIFQLAVEEVALGVIAGQPGAMEKEIVDFVGEDELFDVYAAGAEAGDEVDGLREIDVAVVVAVDEENWRLPGVYGAYRRGFVGEFGEFGRNIFAVPVVGGPVVDAVKVDTGRE